MNKKLVLFLTFLIISQATIADKVIKGGSITVYNKNASDISYGPNRGQSMNSVINTYGHPLKKGLSIGKPPIIKWHYRDFTVIFESKYVIQSVLNQSKQ